MSDDTCGATTRLPSYGHRTCTQPASHQPAPDQPSTSTEGWHQSADHVRWATDEALAARTGRPGGAAVTASKWQCSAGHLSWSPRKLDDCPHGGCGEKVECVAGPHRPKKQQEAK